MSKFALVNAIQKEIQKVNREIDMKIVQGRSYAREARHHKTLLSQLSHINGSRTRALGIFSFF